jgi:hypothetical protein
LATSLASPIVLEEVLASRRHRERGFAIALVTALTVVALAIHGYHPYAEDGGLYMAGIKHLVDPTLYPHGTEFVTEHLRFSVFAPVVAWLTRILHIQVETTLLILHIASFWATLFAAWLLVTQCFRSRIARCGAVALLAMWMTMPVAGTALMLMDRYVTARSFSTPCALFALASALAFFVPERKGPARRWHDLALCCCALAAGAAMHPLMAADATACVLILGCVTATNWRIRVWGTSGLCGLALAVAAILCGFVPPDGAAYRQVAATRHYWFLSQWQWYELVGLAAPLMILGVVAFRQRREGDAARVALARMAVVSGVTAIVVAMLFARVESVSYLVARLQPLRVFQLVYVVMILSLGAGLAKQILQRHPLRWIAAFVLLGGTMLVVERQTFPNSTHLELPWSAPRNPWEQAFVWISHNTPKNALFAMDAQYISKPGEDAQCFRAIAERSILPDYSKDGGEASITPTLTSAWATGQSVQRGLNTQPDNARIAALRPLGVTWVVLDKDALTNFKCDYENGTVKVCRLP